MVREEQMKTAEPDCSGSAVSFSLGDYRNQPLVLPDIGQPVAAPDIGHAPQPDFFSPLTAPGDAAAGVAVLSQVAALFSLQHEDDLPLTAPGAVVVSVFAHAASERRRMLPVMIAKRFIMLIPLVVNLCSSWCKKQKILRQSISAQRSELSRIP